MRSIINVSGSLLSFLSRINLPSLLSLISHLSLTSSNNMEQCTELPL